MLPHKSSYIPLSFRKIMPIFIEVNFRKIHFFYQDTFRRFLTTARKCRKILKEKNLKLTTYNFKKKVQL